MPRDRRSRQPVPQAVDLAVGLGSRRSPYQAAVATRDVPPGRVVQFVRPCRPLVARLQPASPAPVVALLRRALEWGRLLRTGRVASQAELVRTRGFTRSRVSQILALLRLAPVVRRCLLDLPPAAGRPAVSEHALQPLLRLRGEQRQLRALRRLVGRADRAVLTTA